MNEYKRIEIELDIHGISLSAGSGNSFVNLLSKKDKKIIMLVDISEDMRFGYITFQNNRENIFLYYFGDSNIQYMYKVAKYILENYKMLIYKPYKNIEFEYINLDLIEYDKEYEDGMFETLHSEILFSFSFDKVEIIKYNNNEIIEVKSLYESAKIYIDPDSFIDDLIDEIKTK